MKKIYLEDKEFPEILKQIKNPPRKIYYEGNIKILKSAGIAIIGSRNCTEYGKRMTKKFAKELSNYGLNIISGMALGVDSIAHKSTLEIKGKTIAVLPCGLNNIYPKSNKQLYKNIIDNDGLVITEYEPEEEAKSHKFLERNRIVSGLSIGILVIEGGYRSGTSVTARIAKESNKKVFCIPSSVENPKGLIPNLLIKQGNFIVTECEDIINQYPELKFEKKEKQEVNIEENIPKECRKIYNLIKENPIHINEILRNSNIEFDEVNYQLMMLELQGYIQSLPGKNYKRRII